MKVAAKNLIFLVLILSMASVSLAAGKEIKKINGVLTKATKNYVVVNNNKYIVTTKTIVGDAEHPEKGFPYSPKLFSHPFSVVVIIENGTVKKILVEVPKWRKCYLQS